TGCKTGANSAGKDRSLLSVVRIRHRGFPRTFTDSAREENRMTAYVFKPSRRKGGKVHKSRLYSARYKVPGQTKTTTIALHVTDRQVAEAKLHEILRELEREAVGISMPRGVRLARECDINQHVKAYCSDLRARRKDEDYVTTVQK